MDYIKVVNIAMLMLLEKKKKKKAAAPMRYMKNVHTACPKARSHPYIPTKLGTHLTDCLALRVRASNWTGVLGRAVLLRVSRSLRAFCMLLAPMQDLLTHIKKRAIYIYTS